MDKRFTHDNPDDVEFSGPFEEFVPTLEITKVNLYRFIDDDEAFFQAMGLENIIKYDFIGRYSSHPVVMEHLYNEYLAGRPHKGLNLWRYPEAIGKSVGGIVRYVSMEDEQERYDMFLPHCPAMITDFPKRLFKSYVSRGLKHKHPIGTLSYTPFDEVLELYVRSYDGDVNDTVGSSTHADLVHYAKLIPFEQVAEGSDLYKFHLIQQKKATLDMIDDVVYPEGDDIWAFYLSDVSAEEVIKVLKRIYYSRKDLLFKYAYKDGIRKDDALLYLPGSHDATDEEIDEWARVLVRVSTEFDFQEIRDYPIACRYFELIGQ